MGECVEIGSAYSVMHPKPLLSRGFETGVVSLALRAQGVGSLEIEAAAFDGKPVVCGDRLVFGAAPVFLSVVPILVVTGTNAGSGLAEGTAEFLAGASVIRCFSVLVHGKARVTDWIARGEYFAALSDALFERDKGFAGINRFHGIVDVLRVIALIGKERALPQGNRLVSCGEDVGSNSGIHNVGWRCQFIQGQPGDTVYQHMALVTPVELITPLVVLVGSGMNPQSTIWIAFRVMFFGKLVFYKGFWIILLCISHDRCGIQSDEGCVHHTQLIQLPYQVCHDSL